MTKTWKRLYKKIYNIENLRLAFRKARKGKSNKYYVKEFEANIESNIMKLKEELENETYIPMPLHRFIIYDPKIRVIHAPAFRDRVIHHAICNILEPIFDKTFINDSYASRSRKGTHAALQRFDEFRRKVSKSGTLSPYAKDNNMIRGYVLKADIRHYFPSIDHDILICLLRRKIFDKSVIRLLQKIIAAYATTTGKGVPLGALTSQLFANIYLNPLDHFIKERLFARFYLRYLDDFVILHNSQAQIERWKYEIKDFISSKLILDLHSEKTSISPLHHGVPLLGFRCFYYYRLLKKSNLDHLLNRLNYMEDDDYVHVHKSLEGWLAHAAWGNTYRLRVKITQKYNCKR